MAEKQEPIFDLTTYALLASVAFYFISWFLPALVFKGTKGTHDLKVMEGWECAYMGILSIVIGQLEGLSNLCFLGSCILLLERMWKAAVIASGLAVLLAIQTFVLFMTPISFDEAHLTQSVLIKLDIGFYLWIASFLIIFLVSLAKQVSSKIVVQDNDATAVE